MSSPRAPTVGRPRSPERDAAILEAALAEYGEHGIDGMSVEAVAARAGASKATIYRRYASTARASDTSSPTGCATPSWARCTPPSSKSAAR